MFFMNKPKYLFFKILLMIILILPNVVFSDSFLLNNSCFKLKIPNHYYHENKDNQISWIGFGNENKEEFYFENYVIKYFKEKDDQLTLDSRLTFEHCYNCSMMDSGKIESRDIFIYNTNSELNISKMNEEIEESRRIGMKSHMITQKESKLFRNDFYSLRLFKDEKYFDIILDFWALTKDYIYDKV